MSETESELLEAAWGVIANAGYGDWTTQTEEWQAAAAQWRDDWHAYRDAHRVGQTLVTETALTAALWGLDCDPPDAQRMAREILRRLAAVPPEPASPEPT